MVFTFNLLNSSFVIVFHQLNKMGEIIGYQFQRSNLLPKFSKEKCNNLAFDCLACTSYYRWRHFYFDRHRRYLISKIMLLSRANAPSIVGPNIFGAFDPVGCR